MFSKMCRHLFALFCFSNTVCKRLVRSNVCFAIWGSNVSIICLLVKSEALHISQRLSPFRCCGKISGFHWAGNEVQYLLVVARKMGELNYRRWSWCGVWGRGGGVDVVALVETMRTLLKIEWRGRHITLIISVKFGLVRVTHRQRTSDGHGGLRNSSVT